MNKMALKLISMALCIVLIVLAISVPGVANDTVANPTDESLGPIACTSIQLTAFVHNTNAASKHNVILKFL